MKVTYIEHSGFFLETSDADFLFDYYKGEIPMRRKEKPLFVFVSHKHHDHYNPEIFELIKMYPKTKYILSKDVPVRREILKYQAQGICLEDYIIRAAKNTVQTFLVPGGSALTVETLKSTDEGVAFFLEYNGKTIYHAGDLNLWVWEEESEEYNRNMTRAYYKELEKLKGREIDAAFVPLDPRQEKDAFGGMESFLEYTKSRWVFPMHFWGNYGIIDAFLERHPECENQVRRITYAGQSFDLKDIL